jgi:hypothetical protein
MSLVKPEAPNPRDAEAIVAQQQGEIVTIANTGVEKMSACGQAGVKMPELGLGWHLFLTANECFFTNASNQVRAIKTDKPKDVDHDPLNNKKYFSHVANLHHNTADELRWHFKTNAQKPIPLRLEVEFEHKAGQGAPDGPKAEFEVSLHRHTESGQKPLVCVKAAPTWAHGRLAISLEVPGVDNGLYQVTIRPTQNATAAKTFSVVRAVVRQRSKLFVIRERWRPDACHLKFNCSKLAPNADVDAWVYTVQKLAGDTVYIALTTPFGYVGILIDQDGKTKLTEGLNFSLWGHKRNTEEPPLHQLPHFLCIEHPTAEFGTYGHEGHGVKVKKAPNTWSHNETQAYTFALTTRPDLGQVFPDGRLHAFTVSVWDEKSKQFRQFADARFFSKPEQDQHCTNLVLKGFVESAGAEDRNRTGDSRRAVMFSGCVHERVSDTWHEIDQLLIPKDGPSDKFRHVRPARRCFAAGMGGVLQNRQRPADRWASLQNPYSIKGADDSNESPGTPSHVPEFVAHLHQIWKPVMHPEILSCTVKNEQVTFSIKIPNTAQQNRVHLFAGHQDGMALEHKWPVTHVVKKKIFAPGVHDVHVPLTLFKSLGRANDLVVRVLVRNEFRQVWSGDGFKLAHASL